MQAIPNIDYKVLYHAKDLHCSELELKVLQLTHELNQMKKMIFGSRHERYATVETTSQLTLAIHAEEIAACNVTNARKISYTKNTTEQKLIQHPGRMKLPEHLRREEIYIDPKENIAGYKKIGEEITEVLEYKAGELYVKKYVRAKYAAPNNEGVVIGTLPPRPLDKAIAGASLLAQIAIDKYIDHLPLHRQMQRFERAGVKLNYATITDWVSATCKLITPLYEALKNDVLNCGYLSADETPIKVLDKNKKGTSHKGFYWVYRNSVDKLVLFDYRKGRGRDGPIEILEGFTGYLQCDGYNVYDVFEKDKGITMLGCMAHARRMFIDAVDNDQKRSEYVLQQMQILYAIENDCKEKMLSDDERKALRQQSAVSILQSLEKWMKEQYVQVLPKSNIGKAIAYSLERWGRLSRYTEHGMLNIDNNPVENCIRPVAIGRKNYLFCGSHEAAKRSAMLYSLFGTCKMHGINPHEWFQKTLEKIAEHPINRIRELLPHYQK